MEYSKWKKITDLLKDGVDLLVDLQVVLMTAHSSKDYVSHRVFEGMRKLSDMEKSGVKESYIKTKALDHLGQVLYFFSDIHPDDRCQAVENALKFYNENRPNAIVEPSGLCHQRIITKWSFDEQVDTEVK